MFYAVPPKLPPLPHHRPAAIRRPRDTPVVLTIGQTVSVGGVLYIVGPGLIPVGTSPPPPPPPVPPVVSGYSVNPVAGGAAFSILGSGFAVGDTAAFDTGVPLPVTFVDAGHLTAVAPVPATPFSSAVVVTGGGVSARGPVLTVAPKLSTMTVFGFRDANRDWLVGANPIVAAGAVVFVEGAGFGTTAGTVTYAAAQPVTVQQWTDTQITIAAPAYSGTSMAQTIAVRRPDGGNILTLAFGIAAPLPTGLRRE